MFRYDPNIVLAKTTSHMSVRETTVREALSKIWQKLKQKITSSSPGLSSGHVSASAASPGAATTYGFAGRGGIISAPSLRAALTGWYAQQSGMKMQSVHDQSENDTAPSMGHLTSPTP